MSKFSPFNHNSFGEESTLLVDDKTANSYSTSSSTSDEEATPFLSSGTLHYQTTTSSSSTQQDIRPRKSTSQKKLMSQRISESTSINIHDSVDANDFDSMRRFIHDEEEMSKDYDRRTFTKRFMDTVLRRPRHFGRTVYLNGLTLPPKTSYSANIVRNQKYSILTFVPYVLFEQFKFFFNLYFLIVAITQFVPALKVGFLFTYVAPLACVLGLTMLKEAFDDVKRWRRDAEANSQRFLRLTSTGLESIPSSKIKVGDLIQLPTNARVPADCILLRTTEKSGASFIRTDQLDGETDWKLRHAIPSCQKLASDDALLHIAASVYAEAPKKAIYDFIGNFTKYNLNGDVESVESLSLENTIWANTVVASGTVIGLVIYTGKETRSVMNNSSPSSKVGKLDRELNTLSKFLFVAMVLLSLVMVALKKFQGLWFISFFRFLLLFSSIIPISLRVNLDVGKTIYSFFIMRDKEIPGTIVRNSSIPEELGRIEYLFTDKTGTLTQNEMIFKKLNMGNISFSGESLASIREYLNRAYSSDRLMPAERQVRDMIESLALCHNVTPVLDGDLRDYQASSPDEIALVKFSEHVGLTLEERSLTSMAVKTPDGTIERYEILLVFPFTSASKRMGIVLKNEQTGELTFLCKGADAVMTKIVKFSNWLDEECANLAIEGLRTLVFAKKKLSHDDFEYFMRKYNEAKASIHDRAEKVENVRRTLEQDMDLIGVTGVEDLLQENVQKSLDEIRNAGIKVWMLTGDKVETAICIARSTRLVAPRKEIFKVIAPNKVQADILLIQYEQMEDTAMIIDGDTLQICLDQLKDKFVKVARRAPAVVCCRCAPTQKAAIVELMREVTKKRCAAIGDGGNDVSMIQAADVGLGIVGKEGKHASLAADFSINQFSYCTQLLLWHGRNSYKRAARLSQFVIHRGLIISIVQAVFSAIFYFATIPVFTGWLLVGYSTFYTTLPVLSIVLDEDVKKDLVFTFPELYSELQLGRVLSFKTFLIWSWKAVYQGGVIMLLAIFLFESNFLRIQSISFTALILTELLMVILEVHKVNIFMILSEILSIGIYVASIFLLPSYFDIPFILSLHFWWKVIVIVVASCLPIIVGKFLQRKFNPPAWSKLRD